MIVYLLIALLIFLRYGSNKDKDSAGTYGRILLASGGFFILAAVISFLEFILDRTSTIGNLILIIIGALLIILVAVSDIRNARRSEEKDRRMDEMRRRILTLPRSQLNEYLEEQGVSLEEILGTSKDPKDKEEDMDFSRALPGEDDEIPK